MSQKQKLKSERGSLNMGLKDMFMTMTPELFRAATKMLGAVRDRSKSDFNMLLEKFEQHKLKRPENYQPEDVVKMRLIRRNESLNNVLSAMLAGYWHSQKLYDGGFFWRMMPRRKDTENEAQFTARRRRMEDNLMQLMLDVLDDCDYYIKGTQNSQKTQK